MSVVVDDSRSLEAFEIHRRLFINKKTRPLGAGTQRF